MIQSKSQSLLILFMIQYLIINVQSSQNHHRSLLAKSTTPPTTQHTTPPTRVVPTKTPTTLAPNCELPYGCVNQTFSLFERYYLGGYKSAIGHPSIIGDVRCEGSFSCAYAESITFTNYNGEFLCAGSSSCINTTINCIDGNDTHGLIHCIGQNSCMFSKMTSIESRCAGYGSCAYSHIYSIIIKASASHSLYGAIIDTIKINSASTYSGKPISVTLSGDYAGYGAMLICRNNHQCNIHCDGYTSCFMLFIDCIGECIIYNSSENVILPITNITTFQMLKLSNDDIFEFKMLPFNNDEDCSAASTNVTFDVADPGPDKPDIMITNEIKGPICCRGDLACQHYKHIGYKSTSNGNIVCSGYNACRGNSILTTNNGTVFCEGYSSCSSSTFVNVSLVHCMGGGSCTGAMFIHSQQILCAGHMACMGGTTFVSGGVDLTVYFTGYMSGFFTTVYCNETDSCDIICAGYQSCMNMRLFCDGHCTVHCNYTESECPLVTTLSPTLSPTSFPSLYPTQYTLYPTQSPTQYTSFPSSYPTQYTSFPSSYPTQYTLYPTVYPSTSLTTKYTEDKFANVYTSTSFQVTEHTYTVSPEKSNNTTLPIILTFVSVSLCSVCGAVIWYWNQRRNKKQVFKNAKGNIRDNKVDDDDVKDNAQQKDDIGGEEANDVDDSSHSISKLYDNNNKGTEGMAQGDVNKNEGSDESIEKLYDNDNKRTDAYGMAQSDVNNENEGSDDSIGSLYDNDKPTVEGAIDANDGATVTATGYVMTQDDVKKDGESEGTQKTADDNVTNIGCDDISDIYVKQEVQENNGNYTQTTDTKSKVLQHQTLDYYDYYNINKKV